MKAIGVGWTGASGLIYGVRLVEVLLAAGRDVNLVCSATVAQTAPIELGRTLDRVIEGLAAGPAAAGNLTTFGPKDFTSPLASGSAQGGPLVIVPCTMGTVGRIVAGTSETLLLRAADVCLKERRPLIIVARETPLATHHLANLTRLSELGALVMPAAPGFYQRPRQVADLVDFMVQRICDHLAVPVNLIPRWGEDPAGGPVQEPV